MPLMLSQCEWRQTTNRSQPQIDQLHRLLEIGVTVGLAVLVVKRCGERLEARAGHRTIGKGYRVSS